MRQLPALAQRIQQLLVDHGILLNSPGKGSSAKVGQGSQKVHERQAVATQLNKRPFSSSGDSCKAGARVLRDEPFRTTGFRNWPVSHSLSKAALLTTSTLVGGRKASHESPDLVPSEARCCQATSVGSESHMDSRGIGGARARGKVFVNLAVLPGRGCVCEA